MQLVNRSSLISNYIWLEKLLWTRIGVDSLVFNRLLKSKFFEPRREVFDIREDDLGDLLMETIFKSGIFLCICN